MILFILRGVGVILMFLMWLSVVDVILSSMFLLMFILGVVMFVCFWVWESGELCCLLD